MPCSTTSESFERNSFWMSRAAACEPIVAIALLRSVIAVSMEFDAVVAAAVDVEMSVDASEDRIEPVSEKSAPVTEKVFEPAEETVAVATPSPMFGSVRAVRGDRQVVEGWCR